MSKCNGNMEKYSLGKSDAQLENIFQEMRDGLLHKKIEEILSWESFQDTMDRLLASPTSLGSSKVMKQLSNSYTSEREAQGACGPPVPKGIIPINDIQGGDWVDSTMDEVLLRCKMAATLRLIDLYGWEKFPNSRMTVRLNDDPEADHDNFLINPDGLLCYEVTASTLHKVDKNGRTIGKNVSNMDIDRNQFALHSVIHDARRDIRCIIYTDYNSVNAIASVTYGLLPITKDACILGVVTSYNYKGHLLNKNDRIEIVQQLGSRSKVLLLDNHGALCCGQTIEEAFFLMNALTRACEIQCKLLSISLDNVIVVSEKDRKAIYNEARQPKGEGAHGTSYPTATSLGANEFEAFMRALDNAGYRTGHIYRNSLVRNNLLKTKINFNLSSAASSLNSLVKTKNQL